MSRFFAAAATAVTLSAGAAAAQTCGGNYVVQRGDTLSLIADDMYKNAGLWTSIHTGNLDQIGENPNALLAGQTLRLACIDGLPQGLPGGAAVLAADVSAPEATQTVTRVSTSLLGTSELGPVKLLTGDDFAPFTHRGLMNDGLLAEVVSRAMSTSVGTDGYDTFWVNDWSSHLDSLMPAHVMEMAYPWARPDCEGDPENARCVNFHFSQPLFEYLVLLYVDKTRPIPFSTDSDIEGRTLCRPEGYTVHMLDQDGRNWLADDKITLVQPRPVNDCFELLAEGKVDGVVLNEFTARDAIASLDLQDRIEAVQSRPISITGLHVLVHKAHPQAEGLLATINGGLDAIKGDGSYQEIVSRHMTQIWATQ